MTGWTAVVGDGTVGTCAGSAPLTVSYVTPTVSVALSTTSVCSGSPFSVTATAANFSAPATGYTVTSNPTGINASAYPGVFSFNAPDVSTLTTYTLTVGAANSSESASTTAIITVKPTPTLTVNSSSLMRATRCDVPDGQIGFNTNLPNGTYSLSYRKDSGSLQTVSIAVASGQFTLTGLSGSSYSGFSVSNNGCVGTSNTIVFLNGPTLPTVSITPSSTAACTGQSAQLTASGATNYVWSTQQTTASISVTATGAYSVTGTASNGCSGTATASVTVNPLPTQFSVAGGGAYCTGGTGVVVGLSGSQTGVNYQLRRDGNAVGSPVAGTGSAISFGNQTVVGTYTVQATNTSTTCQQTMSGSAAVTTSPLPTAYNVTGGGAYCSGDVGVAVGLSGSQMGVNYQLLQNGSAVGNVVSGTGNVISFGNQTAGGTYTVLATNASTSCQQTMTGSATVTIKQRPSAPSVNSPVVYCQNDVASPLSATASAGGTLSWYANVTGGMAISGAPAPSTAQPSSTNYYVSQTVNGCESPRAAITVTVKPLPSAPALATASGQPYPAGVNSLTASQNTGSVILTVSGCSSGTISWNGGNATTLAVSTATLGTQSFTATCTSNGCTSPVATATVTVVPTTLGVLHRDADFGNTQNNIIKPYLELNNAGNEAIPYNQITVRYWFTSEGAAPPTNFAVYYAPLGTVLMNYVALTQPRQGATGYVEYSFTGGGSLPAQGNSGSIENGIQKTDGSNFNESDDYSYMANYADYIPNAHITAYRNGVLFWGQEPAVVPAQTVVKVYSSAKDGPTTSQIQTRVEVRNEGNAPVSVSNLKVRYYFTSDNGQPAMVYVDYADIGASNVQARVVQLGSPVNGADSYVELTFMPGMPTLAAQSSLGAVDFRIVRSDYGLLEQTNDYSYAANYGNVSLNTHITAYLSNSLVFGTPPSGVSARVAAVEPTAVLQAKVLGNPVTGNQAVVEIKGVEGQAVSLQLIDLQGRLLHGQRIDQAGEREQVTVPLGQSKGQLLLRVSTTNQQQQLKLVRP